ncbi:MULTISPECIES: DUF3631 domain-containing protein [unclassified Mycobacteroides]|uniref:DUF3631 domain-containing protein n=1 Tax=unclassified Mycobacteroides TaxID=2618759 RepID=UPI0012DFD15D|nr:MULTISPECIES: DUF3631 domain-containing protein [unclassified Mycobacteroides]MUM16202.1 hypothetical protein [Mycobacteroides sp. CBMA 326]
MSNSTDYIDTDTTPGQQLLADIRAVFTTELMTSQDLCDSLSTLRESPWHDIGLNPAKLGQRLRKYWKTRHTTNKAARRYHRADYLYAFNRYLPLPPRPARPLPSTNPAKAHLVKPHKRTPSPCPHTNPVGLHHHSSAAITTDTLGALGHQSKLGTHNTTESIPAPTRIHIEWA